MSLKDVLYNKCSMFRVQIVFYVSKSSLLLFTL